MSDPMTCPNCGGRRPSYKTTRKGRFRTQYRKCHGCNTPSKTISLIKQEIRLTDAEVQSVASALPGCVLNGIATDRYEILLIVRPL